MADVTKMGVMSKGIGKVYIEWKIDDFFSCTKDLRSPEFNVLDSTWQLEVRPNGRANTDCDGYVSLYLFRVGNGVSKSTDFSLGIKTSQYPVVANLNKATWKSVDKDKGWGWSMFIKRTKLEQEKENLVPSGNLTIVFRLTLKDDEQQHADVDERKNKLAANLKDMFISKKNTDVVIKVKEETFAAHRFILSARSPVLAAMFENNMSEKETGFVDIPDCNPKAFYHFLLYLYSGELDSKECDYFHLYKIADKYDVSELKLLCVDLMFHNLSPENFCETYMFGDQFSETELLTKVQIFFNENFENIISVDSWESLMTENARLANSLLKGMAPEISLKSMAPKIS